ncbi:hypothetical protein MRB53_024105 [Persea americana]|uniref:Uncharacterized protein n=1 Tax=Persea americana TaxID=3435 RepID=A0ACC2LCF8_PERAE|nr:hypothetical protein MRB53_024105 [Persea americana]
MRPFFANLPALGNLTKKGIERAKVTLMSATTRDFSTVDLKEDPKLGDLLDFLDNLKNYEKSGVPKGAGTDSSDGFDLGRMRRLMERLGNPHSKFKAVHIAGTKGKGSTAAFLSNILREEGYSVGCYTSPHLLTVRERISLGRNGEPVSAESLIYHFYRVKKILDQSVDLENGSLSHFEVFTALAFSLFAWESVDIAIVEAGLGGARDATNVLDSTGLAAAVITSIGEEHMAALGGSLESIAIAKSGIVKYGRPLVMGGPFEPHIEGILRQKASLMNSPVISASDPGIQRIVKSVGREHDIIYQSCDLIMQVEKDLQLFLELCDLRLQMLGSHQLQNAATASCIALCLRHQGWIVSDKAIRSGLERTYMLGRSQFLTNEEVEAVGLSGVSVLIDGAHTEASAKALMDTIMMTYHDTPLALVVAMASDKDHLAFARQLLSGRLPEVVVLMEVSIAGAKSRTASALLLKDTWKRAALELDIEVSMGSESFLEDQSGCSHLIPKHGHVVLISNEMGTVEDSMLVAYQLLRGRMDGPKGLIVVTGSFHLVSSVLASLQR